MPKEAVGVVKDELTQQLETDDDEIEIIEVVGLDEDTPGASGYDGVEEEIVLEEDVAPAESPCAGPTGETAPEAGTVPAGERPLLSDRERYVRLQADFENFKRRVDRERERMQSTAAESLIGRMLPVLDNFERALSVELQSDNEADFRDGVVLIFRQILFELRKEGLEPLEVVGRGFDPTLHEAVETDGGSGFPPNTVVEELQRGYTLAGRLLRPALVRVSVDPADIPENGEEVD